MNVYELMVGVLGKGLFGTELPSDTLNLINGETAAAMFSAAKEHDVAHVFAYAMENLSLLEKGSELKKTCDKEQALAVFRYENQLFQQNEVCRVLDENGIEFVLLKGAVIRDYYPEPWLRSSCDIDILVKEEKVGAAAELLVKELEYSCERKTKHDYPLNSNTGVHVELHFSLFEEGEVIASEAVLNRVWSELEELDGYKNGYKLKNDLFLAYHISHLAKHIRYGGCGIKPILDLCYIDKNLSFSGAFDEMLKENGLCKLYDVLRVMQKAWFYGGEHDERSKRLSDYILSNGVYGTLESFVATNRLKKKGGTFKYAMKRIFVPYSTLVVRYPKLEGKKWLVPFYQIRRWFDIVFVDKNVKQSLGELKINSKISDEELESIKLMNDDLGI